MRRYGKGGARAAWVAVIAGLLSLAGAMGAALTASGEEPTPTLKDALLRNQVQAEAALYETVDSARVFVLDRTRQPPLLQFRDSFEVIALTRVPAARGDELLRTDTGEDLVRVTALGAVTLYPREHPTGIPASRLGPAEPLPSLAASRPDIGRAYQELARRAGQAEVDAPVAAASATPVSALLADALRLTAEGLRASAEAPDGADKIARLTRIQFVYGPNVDARVDGDVLRVELNAERGYAGRPSSFRVADAILGGG